MTIAWRSFVWFNSKTMLLGFVYVTNDALWMFYLLTYLLTYIMIIEKRTVKSVSDWAQSHRRTRRSWQLGKFNHPGSWKSVLTTANIWTTFPVIIGPPNWPIWFCSLASVVRRRPLLSSVTLPAGGLAGRRARKRSVVVVRSTLHGGPVLTVTSG